MIDINKLSEQEISGEFFNEDGKLLITDHSNTGYLKFDRYNLGNSYLRFERGVPKPSGGNSLIFKTNSKCELKIRFPSTKNQTIIFDIEEAKFKNKTHDSIEYHSGVVSNLLYFEEELSFLGIDVEKRRVPTDRATKMFESFYVLKPTEEKDDENLLIFFLLLSTYSGSKFFIREIKTNNEHRFINRISKSRQISIWGSGKLLYPISLEDLERLYQNVEHDFLETVLLLYTSFCTTEGVVEQLVNGTALLDYLIESYREVHGKDSLGWGKTKQLYKLLEILVEEKKIKEYIAYLFKDYPEDYEDISKKFEFWEKRDQYLHRGNLLFDSKEIFALQHSVFVINEILRIIFLQLDKFEEVSLAPKEIYPIRNMEESIEFRRNQITKSW